MRILTAENPVIHAQHNTYYVETDNTHGLFNKKLRYHEQHSASVMLVYFMAFLGRKSVNG